MNKNLSVWLKRLLVTLPLAIPIMAVMHYDHKVLAEIELGDPVELYKSHPLPMTMVSWALLLALVTVFTPFKRVSALAVGIAVGGMVFFAIDQYSQLKDLSEMGLSSKPLMEMVKITGHGKCLAVWIGLCVLTQVVYGVLMPVLAMRKRKPVESPVQD